MKIHYLNCGTMHPRGAALFVPHLKKTPCLCVLIEDNEQLVLVDSGFGTLDMQDPKRLGGFNFILNTQCDIEQTAVRQIERLGHRPADVRHIICTHLDRDHAGGLSDFPHAQVHVLLAERDAALHPKDVSERARYRQCHFTHRPRWEAYAEITGQTWFGMDCVRDLRGLPPEILFVPLPGHTRGHSGVAIDTGQGWLLHCGDAYYVKHEVREDVPTPRGVKAFRRLAHRNIFKAMLQIERIQEVLKKGQGAIKIIASHDQFEYAALFGKPLD